MPRINLFSDHLYILDGQNYERLAIMTAELDDSGPRNFAEDFLGC